MITTLDTTAVDEFRAVCAAAILEYGACVYDGGHLAGTCGSFEDDSALAELERVMKAIMAMDAVGHPGEPTYDLTESYLRTSEDSGRKALTEVVGWWLDWCQSNAITGETDDQRVFFRAEAEKATRAVAILKGDAS